MATSCAANKLEPRDGRALFLAEAKSPSNPLWKQPICWLIIIIEPFRFFCSQGSLIGGG
jgi:hypothetical protein